MRHWGILVSVVLVVGLFAIGFIDQDVYGPPPQKPEKIKLDSISWDNDSESFVVEMSAQFGIATASSENEKFLVSSTLSFTANNTPVEVFGEQIVKKVDGATKDSDNLIDIEPIIIPWNRNGGTFEGLVQVSGEVALINPAGEWALAIFGDGEDADSGPVDVDIGGSASEVCDNEIDDDGDGAVDCQDSECLIDPVCTQEQ